MDTYKVERVFKLLYTILISDIDIIHSKCALESRYIANEDIIKYSGIDNLYDLLQRDRVYKIHPYVAEGLNYLLANYPINIYPAIRISLPLRVTPYVKSCVEYVNLLDKRSEASACVNYYVFLCLYIRSKYFDGNKFIYDILQDVLHSDFKSGSLCHHIGEALNFKYVYLCHKYLPLLIPEFSPTRLGANIDFDGYWWEKGDMDIRRSIALNLRNIYKEKLMLNDNIK